MRKFSLTALACAIATLVWAADWASLGGNPQRDGWAKAEKAFTRQNAKNIELLYKYKADNQARGLDALTTPIVNGNLITYLGFKEMLVFAGSADNAYSVDADLNRLIWKSHFDYKAGKPAAAPTALCPGGLTAAMAMPGSSTAAGRGFGPPPGRGRGSAPGGPIAPPAAAGRGPVAPPFPAPPTGRAALFAAGFGRSGVFLAISSDGNLHPLNTSTGEDKVPAIPFLPPNAKVSALNLNDGVIYAATEDNCGGNPNKLYGIDLSSEETKNYSYESAGASFAGAGGTAIGADGTVYVETLGNGSDQVTALSKSLEVKDSFSIPAPAGPSAAGIAVPSVTPVVFEWKDRDVVVAAGRDGRVYLLDSKAMKTPLAQTDPIASPDAKYAGNGFSGTFSSWEDEESKTRWIYASLWGPAHSSAKFGNTNGDAAHGSIVAFKLEDRDGKPALTPAWTSRDIVSPGSVATANGLVFALSTGESSREAKEDGKPYTLAEREKMATRAMLYVLDGATGAELYNSGNMASTFSHGSGLTVANKRIYFATHDNVVYSLGFLAEQPQLTGK